MLGPPRLGGSLPLSPPAPPPITLPAPLLPLLAPLLPLLAPLLPLLAPLLPLLAPEVRSVRRLVVEVIDVGIGCKDSCRKLVKLVDWIVAAVRLQKEVKVSGFM